jgi:hypothetical protein
MSAERQFRVALLAGFISALSVLGCSAHHDTVLTPESANWTCSGQVTRWRTGQPIPEVQILVQGVCRALTDPSGAYAVQLGANREDVASIRFRKQDYVEVVAALDSAAAVGERALKLDVIMLTEKENH